MLYKQSFIKIKKLVKSSWKDVLLTAFQGPVTVGFFTGSGELQEI